VAKKKTAAPKKTEVSEATEGVPAPSGTHHVVSGLPKFNFNAAPTTTGGQMTASPLRQSYDDVQREAKGPGVEEWKRADKLRADLSATYQSLRDDPRYTEEHKAETAWAKYDETRARVEQLAPEARGKMLRSAESLERLSIPTPEGESLITKDTNKLLLTAHERSRLEGLIARAEKAADKGPFKANPTTILKAAYEQGLNEGGPSGGATVRAVIQLARDYDVDVDGIVDEHRKPHHHGALQDAQTTWMRAQMVGRSVPEPPFKRGGGSTLGAGTYGSAQNKVFSHKRRAWYSRRAGHTGDEGQPKCRVAVSSVLTRSVRP
jgi:hypothetical protein